MPAWKLSSFLKYRLYIVNFGWKLGSQECCAGCVVVMVVVRCALDVMVVMHRLYRATLRHARLSSVHSIRSRRGGTFVMVMVMMVVTDLVSIVHFRQTVDLLMMLCMVVMVARWVSMLVAFSTSQACGGSSAINAVIIEDATFVLHPFRFPALL